MKIIQIRGNNACGKTTAVRDFVKKNGMTQTKTTVGGRDIKCHENDRFIVIGDYTGEGCGGCDRSIKTGDELKNTIAKLAREKRPEALIFEGVMYGKSFAFTYDVYKIAKALKGDFIALCFEPPFETTLERVYARNGGKEVNVDAMHSGWKAEIKSTQKLIAAGVDCRIIDTSKIPKADMIKTIEETL